MVDRLLIRGAGACTDMRLVFQARRVGRLASYPRLVSRLLGFWADYGKLRFVHLYSWAFVNATKSAELIVLLIRIGEAAVTAAVVAAYRFRREGSRVQ